MGRSLGVTDHAVQRFAERWRPGSVMRDARRELQDLAFGASSTRQRTLSGDARIYLAVTAVGERVALAVRDSVVVTVLPRGVSEARETDLWSEELLADSASTVAACQAIVNRESEAAARALAEEAARVAAIAKEAYERERARRRAERLVRDVAAGRRTVSRRVLHECMTLLGMPSSPPPTTPEGMRRDSAKKTIEMWRSGGAVSRKALRRAYAALGLQGESR